MNNKVVQAGESLGDMAGSKEKYGEQIGEIQWRRLFFSELLHKFRSLQTGIQTQFVLVLLRQPSWWTN
jgi:hypothetical protein